MKIMMATLWVWRLWPSGSLMTGLVLLHMTLKVCTMSTVFLLKTSEDLGDNVTPSQLIYFHFWFQVFIVCARGLYKLLTRET